MSAAESFLDSNVILYLVSSDEVKAAKAEELLGQRGVITVQVLNEFTAVARGKLRMEWFEIREVLSVVRRACTIEPVSVRTHEHALDIAERYSFGVYDSMIIAAALQAGCALLFSEDMRHTQRIGSLTIVNPFL